MIASACVLFASAQFSALDTNNDGQISMDELREGIVEAGTGNASVAQLLKVCAAQPEAVASQAAAVPDASTAPAPADLVTPSADGVKVSVNMSGDDVSVTVHLS